MRRFDTVALDKGHTDFGAFLVVHQGKKSIDLCTKKDFCDSVPSGGKAKFFFFFVIASKAYTVHRSCTQPFKVKPTRSL